MQSGHGGDGSVVGQSVVGQDDFRARFQPQLFCGGRNTLLPSCTAPAGDRRRLTHVFTLPHPTFFLSLGNTYGTLLPKFLHRSKKQCCCWTPNRSWRTCSSNGHGVLINSYWFEKGSFKTKCCGWFQREKQFVIWKRKSGKSWLWILTESWILVETGDGFGLCYDKQLFHNSCRNKCLRSWLWKFLWRMRLNEGDCF